MSSSRRSSGGLEDTAGGQPLCRGRYPTLREWTWNMTAPANSTRRRLAIVGKGRVGTALAGAFTRAGCEVEGPLGRGERPASDVVLLCVPDAQIAAAASVV